MNLRNYMTLQNLFSSIVKLEQIQNYSYSYYG